MTDYSYKSDLRSLYFSHVHIFDINYIVNHNLRGSWNIKPNLFVKYNEKPTIYTICVYDEYKNEYWIYDEEKSETQINMIELNNCIKKYETENYKIFYKCFCQNKLEFLTRLNRYDVKIFKNIYKKYSMNFDINNELFIKFINILDEMIEKNIDKNIGTFININDSNWIDKLLQSYMLHNSNEYKFINEYEFINIIDSLLLKP